MPSLSRVMGNDVPFVTNVPVFATATGLLLKEGLLHFLTASTATGTFFGLTTAVSTAQGKYALGPLDMNDYDATQSKENLGNNAAAFRFGSNGIPNRGNATGYNWMEAVINSDQFNYVLWDQTSANVLQSNITASTGTLVIQTGLEASIGGSWIFSTDTTSTLTNTFSGSLRYISSISATTGSCGLTTAMNLSVDSDLVVIRPINHKLTQFDTTGRFFMSTSAAGAGTQIQIFENYIVHAQSPLSALRFWVHDGLDGLAVKSVRLYSEVLYLNHVYRTT